MASHQGFPTLNGDLRHKRAKSSVLRTFIHKRTLSKGTVLPSMATADYFQPDSTLNTNKAMPVIPPDNSHDRALGELQRNQQTLPSSPTKHSRESERSNTNGEGSKPLHKKTRSVISLKSLTGRDTDKHHGSNNNKSKMKKPKSSTNLAALLTRPRSSRNLKKAAEEEERRLARDKENRTPNTSPSESNPPIYAQFATQNFSTQPLGGKFIEDEIDLYTPHEYSPSKQRNFYGDPSIQPTLGRRDGMLPPRSMNLPSNFSVYDISRYVSGVGRRSAEQPRRISSEKRASLQRQDILPDIKSDVKTKSDLTTSKRGSRVMAAVTSLGAKAKAAEIESEQAFEIKDVDAEFEAMLDRRNIPEYQRHKMRSLAVLMKIDFIRQDWTETAAAKSRPGTNGNDELESKENTDVKAKRPRSRTFTLSKPSKGLNSSPKKAKPEVTQSRHSRTKSSDSTTSYSKSLTSAGAAVASNIIAKAKGQLPDDFAIYLRKFPKPEMVEVGRLHKLRLLLRNETVSWTDEFIGLGGMREIVGLLYRIMAVEWREEHEDALLHEVLLCLKALCTTALALQNLNLIQSTLFPALIHMLFDEEKKGPSEFTTRNIITSILFTYLKSAPLEDRPKRARALLSYLRDPEPKEEERPVGFVLDMRRERPYRVWCKEVVNVTKEVFWIFLHNLNVIALPPSAKASNVEGQPERKKEGTSEASRAVPSSSCDTSKCSYSYMHEHFPQELPPVPAAPYVGGVEWDATNYLASHLDLINGILASLETRRERDKLREHLRISGWERCMGSTLRLCKEKFYGGVHAGLKTWVAAAYEDGWDARDVRCGPPVETKPTNTVRNKSPVKKKVVDAPKLDMPKLDFGFEKAQEKDANEGGWL